MTWEHEVDYARLVSVPEIQRLVARHASLAAKRVSAETFLRLASDISHLGIPLDTVGLVGRDLWERLGVKTGKERQAVIPKSTGKVIVSALCSLAHNGQPLKQVRQFADGCVLEAVLPSDLWSFEGSIFVAINRDQLGTKVIAATHVGGQRFDWGKSSKVLDALINDLYADPA